MAEQQTNPFELGPKPQKPIPWGGVASLVPQEGQQAPEGGSYYSVPQEVLQMMWQPMTPQPQPKVPAPQQLPPIPPV